MRGADERTGSLFSYVDLEARVRADHPLRTIREIANAALADLTGEFAALYPARLGRPSIAPERLLRATVMPRSLLARRRTAIRATAHRATEGLAAIVGVEQLGNLQAGVAPANVAPHP